MNDKLFQTLTSTGFRGTDIALELANSILLQFDVVVWVAIHRN